MLPESWVKDCLPLINLRFPPRFLHGLLDLLPG